MYDLQFSKSMFYNFCLIPHKQQLPKHQPISWIEAFRNSGAKQGAQCPNLSSYFSYHWTSKQMTQWKGSVRYQINSQNPASNQGSFNQRRQKPMCLSKTELFLSWFVVNLWAEPIFQAPSPTLSCLDRRKKSAPTNTKQMAFDFSQVLSTHGSH